MQTRFVMLATEALHIDTNIEITFATDTGILFCCWIGPQTNEDIKRSGAIILDLVRKKGITKVLNDNTHVIGSWHDSSQWTVQVWFPAMMDAGLKQFAWIYSSDFFSKLSAKKAKPPSSVIKSFNTFQEAYHWLLTPISHENERRSSE